MSRQILFLLALLVIGLFNIPQASASNERNQSKSSAALIAMLVASGDVKLTHTISTLSTIGGSLRPNKLKRLEGESAIFSVTPISGFELVSISGCNGELVNGSEYQVAVSENCTVAAEFEVKDGYGMVTTQVVGEGTVTPDVIASQLGSSVNFETQPDNEYYRNDVSGCPSIDLPNQTSVKVTLTETSCELLVSFAEINPTLRLEARSLEDVEQLLEQINESRIPVQLTLAGGEYAIDTGPLSFTNQFNQPIKIVGSDNTQLNGHEKSQLIKTNTALTVENITFKNGYAEYGGAIQVVSNYRPLTIINSRFVGNQAERSGGAVYGSRIEVSDSHFESNRAFGSSRSWNGGGAIFSDTIDVSRTRFLNNLALGGASNERRSGHAIYLDFDGFSKIDNSLFVNSLDYHGGHDPNRQAEVSILRGRLDLANVTFSSPAASVGLYESHLNAMSTIFSGSEILLGGGPLSDAEISHSHFDSTKVDSPVLVLERQNVFLQEPVFVDRENLDFNLPLNSNLLGQGATPDYVTDITGFDRKGDAASDMGAFQFKGPRPDTVKINTENNEGGSVYPATQEVSYGEQAEFSLQAKGDHYLATAFGCGGRLDETTFYVDFAVADCTIEAVFLPSSTTTADDLQSLRRLLSAGAYAKQPLTINILPGNYASRSLLPLKVSTTTGQRITLIGQGNIYFDGQEHSQLLKTNAPMTIKNLDFSYGSAEAGGAIQVTDFTQLQVVNSTFEKNTARHSGGAIFAERVKIQGSEFHNNNALGSSGDWFGGGALFSKSAEVSRSLFVDNNTGSGRSDSYNGSDIYMDFDSFLSVDNSIFYQTKPNTQYKTARISSLRGRADFYNSTFDVIDPAIGLYRADTLILSTVMLGIGQDIVVGDNESTAYVGYSFLDNVLIDEALSLTQEFNQTEVLTDNFVDRAGHDYRLIKESQLIRAGDTPSFLRDYAGNMRSPSDPSDIGAFMFVTKD
jgi:predicted outer membrane repeat protein